MLPDIDQKTPKPNKYATNTLEGGTLTMSEQSLETGASTDDVQETNGQAQAVKTYTQEEFDRHMAGLKSSLQKKYEKQFSELGDLDELRNLKTQAEAKKIEEAKKRGEFEKILQDLAAKKDEEIRRRDEIIKEYKVNSPLLSAAARYRAVAPEQVKSLLASSVRLNDQGDVEVVAQDGSVRYTDRGEPVKVEDLVREFLDSNPHFVQSAPSTTNTRNSIVPGAPQDRLDITKLDMQNPEHRARYKEYRKAQGLV